MKNYIRKLRFQDSNSLSVTFYIDQDKVLEIGEKMNALNDLAYMNGYNWEALLNHYLQKNNPEILEGMGSDPEAGMYVAYFDLNEENEKKSDLLIEIIENLIENEALLYDIIKKDGNEIEWD